MEMNDLLNEWQDKMANAENEKDREIAQKRLLKLEAQIKQEAFAEFNTLSGDELEIELQKLADERKRLVALKEKFDDAALIHSIKLLDEKIHHIEQLISPDVVVEFSSKYGPLFWNQTKKTVEVAGMVFSHDELLQMDADGVRELAPIELELKKKMNAKYLGWISADFGVEDVKLLNVESADE